MLWVLRLDPVSRQTRDRARNFNLARANPMLALQQRGFGFPVEEFTQHNEEVSREIGDEAHRDALRALHVSQSVLSGIDRIAAGIQQGGKSGFFGAIGGVLANIGTLALAANPATAWALPLAIAGTGVSTASRFFGRRGETGASSPRAGSRGGAARAPVVNVHNTVMIDGDEMMTTVGRRAASSY